MSGGIVIRELWRHGPVKVMRYVGDQTVFTVEVRAKTLERYSTSEAAIDAAVALVDEIVYAKPDELTAPMQRALDLAILHGSVSTGLQSWYGGDLETIHAQTLFALQRRGRLVCHGGAGPRDPVWGHLPPSDASDCAHCARAQGEEAAG